MAATNSSPDSLIRGLTASLILQMVGKAQENHLREFKLVGDDLCSRDDKRNFAVALSGFANADGGIILWGVDARRDPADSSIDQVVAAPGVGNPRRLIARLTELTSQACLPVPLGVEHKVMSSRRGPSFVATTVAASDRGPHMAKLGEDRYYTRSGGSFIRLEHFQVADMFGRRPRPVLQVSAVQVDPYRFKLRVANVGRGPAMAPFLLYQVQHPFRRCEYGVDGNYNENLPLVKNHSTEGVLHAGDAAFVIHPTMFVEVGGVWIGHTPSAEVLAKANRPIELRFRVGALGAGPEEGVLTIRGGV